MDNLRAHLLRDEGLRLRPYTDTVGKLTIGVGRNLTDRGLSPDEVDYLLTNDINLCVSQLTAALPWFATLDAVRREVLTNMCFNLGIAKLLMFKTTLGYVKRGAYADAAGAMLRSAWAGQVGERAKRLARMMVNGVSE